MQVHLCTSEASLQQSQQQLSELTQKHSAVQAELADSLEYQQQIEAQLNELEMEAQAAKASYEAEQAESQKLSAQLSNTQGDLARVENELTHTKMALDQTSDLNRELQVNLCAPIPPMYVRNVLLMLVGAIDTPTSKAVTFAKRLKV